MKRIYISLSVLLMMAGKIEPLAMDSVDQANEIIIKKLSSAKARTLAEEGRRLSKEFQSVSAATGPLLDLPKRMKKHLEKVSTFVKDEGIRATPGSKQRKLDMDAIQKGWLRLMQSFELARKYVQQKRFVTKPASPLDEMFVGVDFGKFGQPELKAFFDHFRGSITKAQVQAVQDRIEELIEQCALSGCKEKFLLLQQCAQNLNAFIWSIDQQFVSLKQRLDQEIAAARTGTRRF